MDLTNEKHLCPDFSHEEIIEVLGTSINPRTWLADRPDKCHVLSFENKGQASDLVFQ
jgi:hypothetical protein